LNCPPQFSSRKLGRCAVVLTRAIGVLTHAYSLHADLHNIQKNGEPLY
jgi:hypothetical protein